MSCINFGMGMINENPHWSVASCFSVKISNFNKWNKRAVVCLALICYFTFLCLVNQIFIHYVLWSIAKDFLCLEQTTEFWSLATYAVLSKVSSVNSMWLSVELGRRLFSRLANAIDTLLRKSAQHCIQQAVISVFLDNVENPYGVS